MVLEHIGGHQRKEKKGWSVTEEKGVRMDGKICKWLVDVQYKFSYDGSLGAYALRLM